MRSLRSTPQSPSAQPMARGKGDKGHKSNHRNIDKVNYIHQIKALNQKEDTRIR